MDERAMKSDVRGKRASGLCLALCLLGTCAGSIAAEAWRIEIPQESMHAPSMQLLGEHPAGGFLVAQDDGASLWVSRFSSGGQLLEGPEIGPQQSMGLRAMEGGGFAAFDRVIDLINGVFPHRFCERTGRLFGQPLNRYRGLNGLSLFADEARPVAGQTFGTAYFGDSQFISPYQLYLFDRDCSQRVLAGRTSAFWRQKISRDGRSAYAWDPQRDVLQRYTAFGLQWSVSVSGNLLSLDEARKGELLVLDEAGLRRLNTEGEVVWQRLRSDFPLPLRALGDDGDFTYIVEEIAQMVPGGALRPFEQRISTLDAAGSLLAQVTDREQVLVAEIPTSAAGRLWRAERTFPINTPIPTALPSRAVNIAADASKTSVAEFGSNFVPARQLSSGEFVGAPPTVAGRLQVASPTGVVSDVSAPATPITHILQDVRPLEGGTVALLHASTGNHQLMRVDREGRSVWSKAIDIGVGVSGPTATGGPRLLTDSRHVCVIGRRTFSTLLTCVQAGDGATLPQVELDVELGAGRVEFRLMNGALRFVGEQCVREVPSSCASRRLVKGEATIGGTIIRLDPLVDEPLSWVWLDGDEIAFSRRVGEGLNATQVRMVDAEGIELADFELAETFAPMWKADARGAIILSRTDTLQRRFLRQHDFEGRLAWERPVPFELSQQDLIPLENGDWLLLAYFNESRIERITWIERISGTDGGTVWRRLTPLGATFVDSAAPLVDLAAQRIWLSTRLRPEGRVTALDLDGQFLQGDVIEPFREVVAYDSGPAHLTPSGAGVLATWVSPSDQSLQVARIEPDPAPVAAEPIAAGIWNAPDTPGQGLLLQTFDQGKVLAGAWFTFSRRGGSADSEMRWFAVQGERTEGGGYALQLFQASGGQFATPPSVTAEAVGHGVISAQGCDALLFTYQFTDGEMRDLAGAIPLRRTAGTAEDCVEGVSQRVAVSKSDSGHLNGSFYDPASDGQGLLLQAVGKGTESVLTGAWFTFDPPPGANDPTGQHWFTALGPALVEERSELTLFRTFGASLDSGGTDNTVAVGALEVERQGCDLRITWRFDDSLAAGAFAGRTGSQTLRAIEECP